MARITIQSMAVNSGTVYEIVGASLRYVWKNLTRASPVPGKFGTVEVDVAGFENPVLRLNKALIDVDDLKSAVTDAAGNSVNTISLDILKQFAKVEYDGTTSTAIKLTYAYGRTPVYVKDASGTNSFVYVVVGGFDADVGSETVEGTKMLYDIDFVETGLR